MKALPESHISPEDCTLALKRLQTVIHENAKRHGFWDKKRNFGEIIALIHSELSEALEGARLAKELSSWFFAACCNSEKNFSESDKLPGFSTVEEELADVIIRVLDTAGGYNLRLAEALDAKITYNLSRPYKHGKRF